MRIIFKSSYILVNLPSDAVPGRYILYSLLSFPGQTHWIALFSFFFLSSIWQFASIQPIMPNHQKHRKCGTIYLLHEAISDSLISLSCSFSWTWSDDLMRRASLRIWLFSSCLEYVLLSPPHLTPCSSNWQRKNLRDWGISYTIFGTAQTHGQVKNIVKTQ